MVEAWTPKPITIAASTATSPSPGLWQAPAGADGACLVLAHGAGAGMTHRAMAAIADGLAERGVATLRYQFPYMEKGGKRVDPPAVAHAAVRGRGGRGAAAAPALPLFAGGRSFGGRMTSQAQAADAAGGRARPGVLRLPAAPGRQAVDRARRAPRRRRASRCCSCRGPRTRWPSSTCCSPSVAGLGARATLALFADADHSFHVPARTGRKDAEVMAELLDTAAAWMAAH